MKNNLLNKYLMPSYVAAALFAGTAGVATFFAKKDIQMAKENPEKQYIVDRCETTYFICLLIIMASIVMAVFNGLQYPMTVHENAKNITRHYLQDIFARYPETRVCRFILEDSKKLREIAAIACNGLTDKEQKEILNLIKTELNKATSANYDAKLSKIEKAIIDIVQKHAAKNPEYMKKILWAITNAEKPNVFETAQKVR